VGRLRSYNFKSSRLAGTYWGFESTVVVCLFFIDIKYCFFVATTLRGISFSSF
jgi:hypothetical protein